jgi:hypothetical protein
MTVQGDAGDGDINTIIRRFGVLAAAPPDAAQFSDFIAPGSLQEAFDVIDHATDLWSQLPGEVRAGLTPREFAALVTDPSRRDELVSRGILPALPPSVGSSPAQPVSADSAG